LSLFFADRQKKGIMIQSNLLYMQTTKAKKVWKNFSIEVLDMLTEFVELLPRPLEGKYQYQKRLNTRLYSRYSPRKVGKKIYELKKQGLITSNKYNGKVKYFLTNKGKRKLLLAQISKKKKTSEDGSSCVIIFDIPKEKDRHRKFLHRILKGFGFINLQKSVMISNEFLPKEFYDLLKDLGIRQNVSVLRLKILNR